MSCIPSPIRVRVVALFVLLAGLLAAHPPAQAQVRWLTSQKIVFQDTFQSADNLSQWTHAIEDQSPPPVNSDRIDIVPAPGRFVGNAVRFVVPGTAGTWRSELALRPVEQGFKERWYGQAVAVERVATDASGFIVMQWHAQMGADRVDRNFPNLAIAVKNDRWVIRRAYGNPASIQRESFEVPDATVVPRQWADWVVRVRWSEGADGRIEAWLDDRLVYTATGPNLYLLTLKTTPYFKTGIYRPSRKQATTHEPATVVYVRDVRIGRQDATYEEVRAPPQVLWERFVSHGNGECLVVGGGVRTGGPIATAACSGAAEQRFHVGRGGQLVVGTLCVAMRGAGSAASVAVEHCNGRPEQGWRLEWDGTIRSLAAGNARCLAATGASQVTLAGCAPQDTAQQFLRRPTVAFASVATGRCLDGEGGIGPGVRLIAWDCHGGSNQDFTWMRGPHRRIRVGPYCVSAAGAFDKADVAVRDCNGGPEQLWALEANGLVRSLLPGRPYCMDVAVEDANNISLLGCWPTSPDQQFRLTTRLALTSNIDGRCLDVSGGLGLNRPLIVYPCLGTRNQMFTAPPDGTLRAGEHCIEVTGSNRNLAPVVTAPCHGGASQQWNMAWDGTIRSRLPGVVRCMEPMPTIRLWECLRGDPYHQFRAFENLAITNVGNQRCMDVRGGIGRGRSVIAWPCSGAQNQQFWTEFDNELRVGAYCVTAARAADNVPVTLQACGDSPNRQWSVDSNGGIRSLLPGTPHCLTMPASSGAGVTLQRCDPNRRDQRFEPM